MRFSDSLYGDERNVRTCEAGLGCGEGERECVRELEREWDERPRELDRRSIERLMVVVVEL